MAFLFGDGMRRWQKWGLAGAALAALLLAFAAIFVNRLIDGEALKQTAQEKVRTTWGRELQIGQLDISLLPFPHLRARDVSVNNPDWAQERLLLQAKTVEARFGLLALIRGKFELESLRFDGTQANLEISPDGRRSWEMPSARVLQASDVQLTDLHIKNSQLLLRNRQQEPLRLQIVDLDAEADAHLRNVELIANLQRNEQTMRVEGKFDDLASFGKPGAATGGALTLKSGEASARLKGTLPLSGEPDSYAFSLALEAPSLTQAYNFLGVDRRAPVALKAHAQIQGSGRKLDIRELKFDMGEFHLQGMFQLDRSATRPVFHADLRANQFDMVQTFLDAGRDALKAKPDGQLFRDNPLPWPLLNALQGSDGSARLTLGDLKLRNGIHVREAHAQANFRDDRMEVTSFDGRLLDGEVHGSAVFTGKPQSVHLDMKLDKTLLGQWFAETGKKVRIDGGRMQVDTQLDTHGNSMKELAANISGPLDIRIADATVHSEKVGQAEYWFNGLFSAKDSNRVALSCGAAKLRFANGVAKGQGIVGARSADSQLLSSGVIDMRKQQLDLRGRVRARSGISLGISTFSSEVKISGPVAKPEMGLDESGAPEALARIGAAILTSGVSIVATSIWDGANPESDPCRAVFARKAAK